MKSVFVDSLWKVFRRTTVDPEINGRTFISIFRGFQLGLNPALPRPLISGSTVSNTKILDGKHKKFWTANTKNFGWQTQKILVSQTPKELWSTSTGNIV
jgi:hypothetical protein